MDIFAMREEHKKNNVKQWMSKEIWDLLKEHRAEDFQFRYPDNYSWWGLLNIMDIKVIGV